MDPHATPSYEEAITSNSITPNTTGYNDSKAQYIHEAPEQSQIPYQQQQQQQPQQSQAAPQEVYLDHQQQRVAPQEMYPDQPQQYQAKAFQAQQPQTMGGQAKPANTYQSTTPLQSLGEHASPVDCPVCGCREMTITEYESGGVAFGTAAILCFCCCLGCIPFMFGSFKNVLHKCGRCSAPLAMYHRSGGTEVLRR